MGLEESCSSTAGLTDEAAHAEHVPTPASVSCVECLLVDKGDDAEVAGMVSKVAVQSQQGSPSVGTRGAKDIRELGLTRYPRRRDEGQRGELNGCP